MERDDVGREVVWIWVGVAGGSRRSRRVPRFGGVCGRAKQQMGVCWDELDGGEGRGVGEDANGGEYTA